VRANSRQISSMGISSSERRPGALDDDLFDLGMLVHSLNRKSRRSVRELAMETIALLARCTSGGFVTSETVAPALAHLHPMQAGRDLLISWRLRSPA